MASLSKGDEVEATEAISGGLLGSDVRRGQKGIVLKASGSQADVQFLSDGVGWPQSKIKNISLSKLKKR